MGARDAAVERARRALAALERLGREWGPEALERYAEIPGAQTELVEGAGHSPNVEMPADVASMILTFAEQPSPAEQEQERQEAKQQAQQKKAAAAARKKAKAQAAKQSQAAKKKKKAGP